MKIGYLLIVHKNPEQVLKLVNQLSSNDSQFFIHIDKKKEVNPFMEILPSDTIHFITNRVRINWGGYSIVQATLNLIKSALKYNLERLILLSGQDFPIKTNEEILKTLSTNSASGFMDYSKLSDWNEGGLERIRYYHPIDLLAKLKLGNIYYRYQIHKKIACIKKRSFLKNIVPYRGSQWWILTNEMAQYILDYESKHPEFFRFYKHTSIPDEMVFQTILMNSPYSDMIINNDLREISLTKEYNPKIICESDYENLIYSKNLFARKFDSAIDPNILTMLENYFKK